MIFLPNREVNLESVRGSIKSFIRNGKGPVTFLLFSVLLAGTTVLVVQGPRLPSRADIENAIIAISPSTAELSVNQSVDAQIYVLLQENPASGIDVVLKYEPSLLEVTSIIPNEGLGLISFLPQNDFTRQFQWQEAVDFVSGEIRFSALAYNHDAGEPSSPIESDDTALLVATISFRALAEGQTGVSFLFNGGRDDCNVSVVSGDTATDVLQEPVSQMSVVIQPTIIPTATPTPILTSTPTPTGTVIPTSTPTLKPTSTPTLKPTPTPIPVPGERLTVYEATLKRVWWRFNRLVVKASSSDSPNVKLSVVSFGKLKYSPEKDFYQRTFLTTKAPKGITIVSTGGAEAAVPVDWVEKTRRK